MTNKKCSLSLDFTLEIILHIATFVSEADPNFQLDFPAAGITDQSRLTIDRNLYAVTICFWMKTTDIDNYGTPFSYATKDNDNTFTLLDYGGSVAIKDEAFSVYK